jgi:topoisomerase-4 subunit B
LDLRPEVRVLPREAREAARKAKEAARGNNKTKRCDLIFSDKLAAAQSKDYAGTMSFSSSRAIPPVAPRKPAVIGLHQAILPLRGKPLNTDTVTMERMLQNVEFSTLIQTIGAGVGAGFRCRRKPLWQDHHHDRC